MGKLPVLKPREVCRILENLEFSLLRGHEHKYDDVRGEEHNPDLRRASNAALSPLAAKSLSAGAMVSSKSATRWWIWLLTPQTRKSPKGGSRRNRTTGRFLVWPSAWGRGARAMSPSFMGANRPPCIPVRCRRKPSTTGWRKTSTKCGVRHPGGAPRPPAAHWGEAGRVHPVGPSRHQNGLSVQPLSSPYK